ncbi:hypothetical protein IAD21_04424 [Abditibacteriota bacterium]|nr:hypothetical protein IAD21_04424 [Abditibacteriota bacterium]
MKIQSKLPFSLCAGLALALLVPVQAQAQFGVPIAKPHAALPSVVVPEALGVNIHFTDAREGELKMLADGGFRVIRMDFGWSSTEKAKGVYDFSAFDRLVKGLDAHKLQPLFILDYSNPLYDEGLSPYSDSGRTAFANWAGAAAAHFKGHKVLWEMYNEPNGGFWKPKADVQSYIKLALATGQAIQRDAPGECYIGPGVSGMDFNFMEACFQAGLLGMWDAVSVHPYRQSDPESVGEEYRRLRLMIKKYKPKGKTIPILSGEWGYSSVWNNYNDELQGKYLPRQWMTNLMNGVPVSIWYDWHDDGTDPKEPEHHFGTTNNAYFAGRNPVYDPKPSYTAAKTLSQFLSRFQFNKRLALNSPDDYLLLFSPKGIFDLGDLPMPQAYRKTPVKIGVWTTGTAHDIVIPASEGTFKVVNYLGEGQPDGIATAQGLKIRISDTPLYLESTNNTLQQIARWAPVPLDTLVTAPATIQLEKNGAQVSLRRDSPPIEMRMTAQFGPMKVAQITEAVITNPLSFIVEPSPQNTLLVQLENPFGVPTAGQVSLNGAAAQTVNFTEQGKILTFPMPARSADGSWEAKVRFTGKAAGDTLESTNRFVALSSFAGLTPGNLATSLVARGDGDAAIVSEQTLTVTNAPEPAPNGGPVLKLSYRFAPGWKFANIQPLNETWAKIDGHPKRLGMWVYGDNSGQILRMRFSDSEGQTFQPNGTPINWKGWRYYSFPLDGTGGHWGGANDGQVRGTIKVESLFLLDSAGGIGGQGEIYIGSPSWIY